MARRAIAGVLHIVRQWKSQWKKWTLLAGALWIALPASGAKLEAVYPRPMPGTDFGYAVALLDLALSESGVDYELRPSELTMQQNRALTQLARNVDISVAWSMTSREREKDLLPIRIPIDKGLIGWRIFFIHRKNAKRLAQIQSLEQLKALSAGQEHDWPDVEILAANGLRVDKSSDYASLFAMLEHGRFDYFPRSIEEIWDEEKEHRDANIEVEKTIIQHYPAAEYFFVNKQNKPLAAALDKGLRVAIKNGSFDKLFRKFNGKALELANIKSRKIFNLSNPLLPDETPLDKKELWLDK